MDRAKHPSIVALAPNEWHDTWMNRQHLLTRLAARGWPVLYSTGCLSTWDRGSPRWRASRWWHRAEQSDGVLVDDPGRLACRWPRARAYDRQILAAYCRRLRSLAGWQEPEVARIAYLFHPSYYPYLEHLEPDLVVYHVYDLHRAMGRSRADLAGSEGQLVSRCDLLTVVNPEIARALPEPGPTKAVVLGNGVDLALFDGGRTEEPEDLAAIPRPRIGYTGNINPKLDWETIEFVARRRPDWHWVFVGQLRSQEFPRAEIARAWEACRRYPNVHFLGRKAREAVPAYVHNLDVCTICYRVGDDDWVRYGYPLKLHEYLACGKPTVATDLPAVREFQPPVRIALNPEDWLAALGEALADDDPGAVSVRREVARRNSWDSRVDQLEGLLRRFGLAPRGDSQ